MRNPSKALAWGRALGFACLAGTGLAWPAVAAAQLLDPPADYRVQGTAEMYVHGSRCCGDTRFAGRFDGAYSVTSSGDVVLSSLRLELDDRDIVVTDGFLGLFSTRVALRCPSGALTELAHGRLLGAAGGPGRLQFDVGTLKFGAASSENRDKDGSCDAPTLELDAQNNAPVLLTHYPLLNQFAFTGHFTTTISGDSYSLDLNLAGSYSNRPPVATVALLTPGVPQGGCPARQRWNGQQWEWVADANDRRGWVGEPYSYSFDRDGTSGRSDIYNELWYRSRDSGPRALIGQGVHLPAEVFEWGPRHTLELLAVDYAGASSAEACQFRVIDATPPTVIPPKPLTLSCTVPGGVTPPSSPELRAFLAGATATDIVDPAPVQLPPQLGGRDVTDTTLFPADNVAHPVAFRFRDATGNVGSASSSVTVADVHPPSASVSVTPAVARATGGWLKVRARLTATDDCGGLISWRLVSIVSNAPWLDAADIRGARLGFDDRSFSLRARRGRLGVARIYTITYEARDVAGNRTLATARVVVGGVR